MISLHFCAPILEEATDVLGFEDEFNKKVEEENLEEQEKLKKLEKKAMLDDVNLNKRNELYLDGFVCGNLNKSYSMSNLLENIEFEDMT